MSCNNKIKRVHLWRNVFFGHTEKLLVIRYLFYQPVYRLRRVFCAVKYIVIFDILIVYLRHRFRVYVDVQCFVHVVAGLFLRLRPGIPRRLQSTSLTMSFPNFIQLNNFFFCVNSIWYHLWVIAIRLVRVLGLRRIASDERMRRRRGHGFECSADRCV